MFHQAHDFVITNSQFTSGNNHDAVSTILLPHVATGAIFDSAERYPPGRCHPGTRQRMIDQITNWIDEVSTVQRILWLNGSAGNGKSALMQAICELLRDSDPASNGGSFFFARGDPNRGKGTKLFLTLSYQLAVRFPSVRKEINDALDRDPSLPTKSLDIQLRFLIIDPLLSCEDFPSPTPPILFIDGLDECDNDEGVDTQCEIITLISKSIVEDSIPIRFMIASRPESRIQRTFEAFPLSDITFPLSLLDDDHAFIDILDYLTDGFEAIRLIQKNSQIMQSVVLPWPPEDVVRNIACDASGQYLYASTILKFVGGHPFTDPQEQLRIITTHGPDRAFAFTRLDRLYTTILSTYPRWERMKCVLGGHLANLNLIAINVVLEVPRTEIILVLDALRSLVDVDSKPPPKPDDSQQFSCLPSLDLDMSLCHLSFREFFLDETRSGPYHIDLGSVNSSIIRSFLGLIKRNLEWNYKKLPYTPDGDISVSEYGHVMLQISLYALPYHDEFWDLIPVFHDMVETFRGFIPGRHMDHPQYFDIDMMSLRLLFGEIYACGVKFNALPTSLQMTKQLEILPFFAQVFNTFFYVGGSRGLGVVRVTSIAAGPAWAAWRIQCLSLQVYATGMGVGHWVWYKLGGTPEWPDWDIYLLSPCGVMLCTLGTMTLSCRLVLWVGRFLTLYLWGLRRTLGNDEENDAARVLLVVRRLMIQLTEGPRVSENVATHLRRIAEDVSRARELPAWGAKSLL